MVKYDHADVIPQQNENNEKKVNVKLVPPKKDDQPKPQKRKYTKSKLKIENDQKQKKITSMFQPKLPSRIVENKTSELSIYTEDSNFEDDLTFKDNPTTIDDLSKGVCSPQPLARQDLPGSNDVLEDSKDQLFSTNQQQPDLAPKGLSLLSNISNQQITGEKKGPNDQITSEIFANGSVYHELEKDQHQNLIENVCKVIK